MNSRTTAMETFQLQSPLRTMLWASGLALLLFLAAVPVRAANTPVPWECSNYAGEAQIRCLTTLMEFQRDRIGQLEGELRAQEGAVGRLKEQIDRQAVATSDLQSQLSDRPATAIVPTPYPYVYPPNLGLGIYLGRPWIYGPSYSFRPYGGFRVHRPWGHRR